MLAPTGIKYYCSGSKVWRPGHETSTSKPRQVRQRSLRFKSSSRGQFVNRLKNGWIVITWVFIIGDNVSDLIRACAKSCITYGTCPKRQYLGSVLKVAHLIIKYLGLVDFSKIIHRKSAIIWVTLHGAHKPRDMQYWCRLIWKLNWLRVL